MMEPAQGHTASGRAKIRVQVCLTPAFPSASCTTHQAACRADDLSLFWTLPKKAGL